jgi:hypothetical protein
MNATVSFAERTMVAIDYFLNSAMSRAWASVCERVQPPSEEDYGGGDICSLEATTSTQDDHPLE